MAYAINNARTIVSISLQEGNGLLTLTVCNQGLGDVTNESDTEVQSLIPSEVWGEFPNDITFDFELQLTLSITYDYVDPDKFCDGDSSDSGYLLTGSIDDAKYYHNDFDLPMGLVPFSGCLNDLKKCDPDLTFDFHDLQRLAECTHTYDETGRYASLIDVIIYLTSPNTHGWYTASYGTHLTLGIHHV